MVGAAHVGRSEGCSWTALRLVAPFCWRTNQTAAFRYLFTVYALTEVGAVPVPQQVLSAAVHQFCSRPA